MRINETILFPISAVHKMQEVIDWCEHMNYSYDVEEKRFDGDSSKYFNLLITAHLKMSDIDYDLDFIIGQELQELKFDVHAYLVDDTMYLTNIVEFVAESENHVSLYKYLHNIFY